MSFTQPEPATPRLTRSELAVPGVNPALFDKAAKSAADVIFLDLEDAVAPDDKPLVTMVPAKVNAGMLFTYPTPTVVGFKLRDNHDPFGDPPDPAPPPEGFDRRPPYSESTASTVVSNGDLAFASRFAFWARRCAS